MTLPGGSQNFQSLSRERKDWLPAIEVRQGIFLGLSPERLAQGEDGRNNDGRWRARIAALNDAYRQECKRSCWC